MECSICLEAYDARARVPRVLTRCGHTVCDECVTRLAGASKVTIACPHCRSVTPLTEVRTNYAIAAMIEEDRPSEPVTTHQVGKCASHPSENVTLFCATCYEFICIRCYDTWDQAHAAHSRVGYEEGLSLVKQDIERVDAAFVSHLHEVDAKIAQIRNAKDRIKILKDSATRHFENVISDMRNELDGVLHTLAVFERRVDDDSAPMFEKAMNMRHIHSDLQTLKQTKADTSNRQLFEYYASHRSEIHQRMSTLVDIESLNESLDRVSIGTSPSPAILPELPELTLHAFQGPSLFSIRIPSIPGGVRDSPQEHKAPTPPLRPIPRKTSNDNINS